MQNSVLGVSNEKTIFFISCQAPGPLLGPGQGPGQGPGAGPGQGQGPGQCP